MKTVKKYLKINIGQFDDALTFDQVKTFLEANKDNAEVQAYYKTDVVTGEAVKTYLATADGKKVLQPLLDSNFTKGLETWKTNNLDALVEDELKKRNPDETPEQKRIRELEEKLEKQERDNKRSTLKESALKYATDKGYDAKFATKWIDKLLGDDEATTNTTLEDFKTDLDGIVQSAVESKFRGAGRDIDHQQGGDTGGIDISAIAGEVSLRK